MTHPLVEYFRCPEHLAVLGTGGPLSTEAGYFRFGDAIAYGRQAVAARSPRRSDGALIDLSEHVSSLDGQAIFPFDLSEVLSNLRHERYPEAQEAIERLSTSGIPHALYYFFRPALPVGVRKHLQRLRLTGWRRIRFPQWPVDVTTEILMKNVVRFVLQRTGIREFPFIWFWPDGAPGCVMMTHDVEGAAGAKYATDLMDLDGTVEVRSAFQIVPDAPWASMVATRGLVEQLQGRDFEVNVHDLSHDGHLFRDRQLFLRRVATINALGREWGCHGFRSGAMYRRQGWFGALEFSYDMSVPNVAHLEPQRGGCCTVLPFFIGEVLELPLTTTQDYTLFHVLGDYSTALWQEQIRRILAQNGLVSFIVHPDYLLERRARTVYMDLLRLLVSLRDQHNLWLALPCEINEWWRHRRKMRLVANGGAWRIEGPASERARVAYARVEGEHVVYEVGPSRRAA